MVADSWDHPRFAYYPQIKDDITIYPYDPSRAIAMLADVGWTRGSDGVMTKAGNRFQLTITYTRETETATVLADNLKALGIDTQINQLTPFQLRDAQVRASFTGGDVTNNPMGGLSAVRRFASEQTPTAQNNWAGTNRGSFTNPDWDRIGTQLR